MLSQINDLVSKWILICKLLVHFHWSCSFPHKCIQPIYPNLCFYHPQNCSISNNLTIEAWFGIQKPVWIHNIHIWEFGLHLIIMIVIFTKLCLNKDCSINMSNQTKDWNFEFTFHGFQWAPCPPTYFH